MRPKAIVEAGCICDHERGDSPPLFVWWWDGEKGQAGSSASAQTEGGGKFLCNKYDHPAKVFLLSVYAECINVYFP